MKCLRSKKRLKSPDYTTNEGPRAEPEGVAEACAGGNHRPRWPATDSEVCGRGGGGAVGKPDNHTRAISVQNAQDGRQGRGRRRQCARRGRGARHAGRGTTAHDAAGSRSRETAAGGRGPKNQQLYKMAGLQQTQAAEAHKMNQGSRWYRVVVRPRERHVVPSTVVPR
jgi:hypothetical protein